MSLVLLTIGVGLFGGIVIAIDRDRKRRATKCAERDVLKNIDQQLHKLMIEESSIKTNTSDDTYRSM